MTRRVSKRVRFSPGPPRVHIVPRGGREQEPGFVARLARHAALKLHMEPLGVRISRGSLDRSFGNGTGPGSLGRYTNVQARRNTWHRSKHAGQSWYRPVRTAGGRIEFVSRYDVPAHDAAFDEMLLNYTGGVTPHAPY